jgi:hypothetical protein
MEEKYMNKKILAVALAILFIATAFTACKAKLEMTEINGKEYPLATDGKGNTIFNEENQVAVIVTDRAGEVITYEDGEDQTYWLQLEGSYVTDDYIQGAVYKLGVPDGWKGTENGRIEKNGTDGKCYIKFETQKKLKGDETLEEYLDILDSNNEAFIEAISDPVYLEEYIKKDPSLAILEGCKYNVEKTDAMLPGNLNAKCRITKVVDKNGEVISYSENYHFVVGETIYGIYFNCNDGKCYNESFDFSNYLNSKFQFKAPKK